MALSDNVILLSNGYAFAKGSVVMIGPLWEGYGEWGDPFEFIVKGIGFEATITAEIKKKIKPWMDENVKEALKEQNKEIARRAREIHQEFVDKLL